MLWRFGITLSQKGLPIEVPGGAHELGDVSKWTFSWIGVPFGTHFSDLFAWVYQLRTEMLSKT